MQPDNNVAWQYTKIREIKEKKQQIPHKHKQTDSADQNLPEAVKKRSRSLFKGVNMKKYKRKRVEKNIFVTSLLLFTPQDNSIFSTQQNKKTVTKSSH